MERCACLLQEIYPIDWGDNLIGFFGLFAPLNMDLLDITSVGCQVTLTFYMSYLFVAIVMPLVIILLVYLWYRLRIKFVVAKLKRKVKCGLKKILGRRKRLSNLKFQNIAKKTTSKHLRDQTKSAVKQMKLRNTATMLLFQAATLKFRTKYW